MTHDNRNITSIVLVETPSYVDRTKTLLITDKVEVHYHIYVSMFLNVSFATLNILLTPTLVYFRHKHIIGNINTVFHNHSHYTQIYHSA